MRHYFSLFFIVFFSFCSQSLFGQYAQNEKWMTNLEIPSSYSREFTYILEKPDIPANVLQIEIEKAMKAFNDSYQMNSRLCEIVNCLAKTDKQGRSLLEISGPSICVSGWTSFPPEDPRGKKDDVWFHVSRCEIRAQARDGRYRLEILFPYTPTTLEGSFWDVTCYTIPSLPLSDNDRYEISVKNKSTEDALLKRYHLKGLFSSITDKLINGVDYDKCYSRPKVGLPTSDSYKYYSIEDICALSWHRTQDQVRKLAKSDPDLYYELNGRESMLFKMVFYLAQDFDGLLDKFLAKDLKTAIDAAKDDAW